MSGRRPKPTALKVVEGNKGRRPLNGSEPKPKKSNSKPPAHLSSIGKKTWSSLIDRLGDMNLMTIADEYALERLVDCYAEILAYREAIKINGHTYTTENVQGGLMVRPRPEVGMLADADRRFKSYLVEFGLTPAARSKVKEIDPENEDKTGHFFAR